jgi:hypothetical protein
MLRFALAACVLLVATGAHAESQCKPGKGTPIFEARWSSPPSPGTIITKIYATGAYTRVETNRGQSPKTKKGCISDIGEIQKSLKTAKWKKTKQEPCYGQHTDRLDFYVNGVKRHTRTTCAGYDVDEATDEILETIKRRIPDWFSPMILPESGGE